jgi:hypothetical protein
VQQYSSLSSLAMTASEDEVLYGRHVHFVLRCWNAPPAVFWVRGTLIIRVVSRRASRCRPLLSHLTGDASCCAGRAGYLAACCSTSTSAAMLCLSQRCGVWSKPSCSQVRCCSWVWSATAQACCRIYLLPTAIDGHAPRATAGRRGAASCSHATRLYYKWHSKAYLGAAHGMMGTCWEGAVGGNSPHAAAHTPTGRVW